jgi:hypothetical protein
MEKRLLIGCEVLKNQIDKLGAQNLDFIYLEQMLHRTPEKLQANLQKTIKESPQYQTILFGYGLCSNALLGLTCAPNQRLVIPKVDDCIGLSLGSRTKYICEFYKNSGTYYFTCGWVDEAGDPYKEYLRCVEKYGEEDAKWIAGETLKNYSRTVLIRTDEKKDVAAREYVRQFADFFELNYDEMDGDESYLRKLIFGPWDDEFVILEHGQTTDKDMFVYER